MIIIHYLLVILDSQYSIRLNISQSSKGDVNTLISDKLSRSEMNVLQIMQENRINCEERAVKIRTISEMCGLSYFSIRNIIKSFYVANLVCKSRRDGNAETYFLVDEKGE